MNAYLQALADKPLDIRDTDRCTKVWLPEGKRRAPRGRKPEYHGNLGGPALKRSEIEARKLDEYSAKLVAILDYYAATSVPFERIADHTKLPLEKVVEAMSRRGREG
jgi:hypothetical protein